MLRVCIKLHPEPTLTITLALKKYLNYYRKMQVYVRFVILSAQLLRLIVEVNGQPDLLSASKPSFPSDLSEIGFWLRGSWLGIKICNCFALACMCSLSSCRNVASISVRVREAVALEFDLEEFR